MKLANIIFENELINHTKVDYVNYYNEPQLYDDIDKTLPTLYVGWNFMKKSNPNNQIIQNADILKERIIKNYLYFTFSFDESKSTHVKGVDKFIKKAPELYFNPKYKYINNDPVFLQIHNIDDLFNKIPKEIDSYYLLKNDMLYILCGKEIFGLDLKMYNYFQFNVEKIKNEINNRASIKFNDLDGNLYAKYYKKFPDFSYLKRYLVVLLTNNE